MAAKDIFTVSENFKRQLAAIFANGGLPESDAVILERISKASKWFQEKFAMIFDELVQKLRVETDNRELRKKIDNAIDQLKQEIAVKLAGICCCEKGFSPSSYLRAVSAAELDFIPGKTKKNRAPAYTESDIAHPELYQALKDWRARQAEEQQIARYQVLHQRVLVQVVVCLPDTIAALLTINGVGKKTIEKYGAELVAMVSAYRQKKGIEQVVLPEPEAVPQESTPPPQDAPPAGTRDISFDMFRNGLTIAQIARERGLVQSTIEAHLCFFVETGQLDINKLLPPEKQQAITEKLDALQSNSLSEVKKELGPDYTYGQIKMVLALRNYLGEG
ncbi:MAG: helix-turn-helix domain-containing protein [Desulfobacterales bacterium]|nr:helix-turn-helix domain-containing protein [Desulfobacterales bacterium]